MRKGSSLKSEYYPDRAAANLAVEFFEKILTHVKGEWAGQPLSREKWQRKRAIEHDFEHKF